jgi:carbamoyltransferase
MSVYWGVNLSHDGSICQVNESGEIDWFVEEERYSRIKQHDLPMTVVPFINYDKEINPIQISTLYESWDKKCVEETAKNFSTLVEKFYNRQNSYYRKEINYDLYLDHHIYHAACGFYNSGFRESAVLVVDGMGNYINGNDDYQEVETIYTMSYPNIITTYQKNVIPSFMSSERHPFDTYPMGIGAIYSSIADYFGFGTLGSGKLMGLSAYGKEDPNIKPFIIDGKLDCSQFYRTRYGLNFIPYEYVSFKRQVIGPENSKFSNLCNLAYRVQKDFEDYMINLILYTLKLTGSKNLVLTGGCALNCVANYRYLNCLPKDVNLYIEPISTDAGTSIGLAKLNYYSDTRSTSPKPLKSLYLGLE